MSSKKTGLVTGTSKGGIGDYLVQELLKHDFHVFATARDLDKVQHLQDLGAVVLHLDVTDPQSIKKAVTQVSDATGGTLDILINNSGVLYQSSLMDADMKTSGQLFDVNVFGVLNVVQEFGTLLIAAQGTIVNIGSILGRMPLPFQGVYNASKAALEQISRTLRIELSPFNVKVIHVVTGGIDTSLFIHGDQVQFADTSLYFPGRETLSPWLNGDAARKVQTTSPEVYARKVVENAMSSGPKSFLWVGNTSSRIWFISNLLWANAWDWLLWMMGFPDMKVAIFGQKKTY